jgi:hypothetical protein
MLRSDRDKKVVGVFVLRFRAPLHWACTERTDLIHHTDTASIQLVVAHGVGCIVVNFVPADRSNRVEGALLGLMDGSALLKSSRLVSTSSTA